MHQLLIAGRYRLLDLVGTGGMGRVWLARDEMLHRDVAVKEVVPPSWLAEAEREELRLRTLREARTAARLNHPNVVRIYDVVHDRENPWIVMEYVPSRSVQQIISAEGPLSPQRTARIGLAVLAALRAAHRAGVLHRDVKPHNVLVADDGRVVLTDFGLATFDGGEGAMTGPGMVLGSPQFVAPERAREGVSDPRTDLWSLGATLFAAVEGQSPYARSSAMATLSALATEPPDPMLRAGPLRPALTGLLEREPWRRLTAIEVEPLLRRAAADHDQTIGPAPSSAVAAVRNASRAVMPDPVDPAYPVDPAHPIDPAGPAHPIDPAGPAHPIDPAGPVDPAHPVGPATPALRPASRLRRRRQRLVALVATATALLAAMGVTWALVDRNNERTPPSGAGGGGAPTSRPAAFACAKPPPPPPTSTPVASVPRPADARYRLRDGWTWHDDPAGFRIAAPVGWTRWTEGAVTCFREPDGARVLSVEAGPARPDPVAYWQAEEVRLTIGDPLLTNYRKVDISAMDIFEGGAVWECGWENAAGEQVHSFRLLANTSARRSYIVSWLTKEFDWQVNAAYLPMIRQSFTPAM
ncbi:tRNA A-37 threonylcarbamoyl transferase component Bud32 [Micromonospora luteifusca]|uniref:non-specific serine/threonine protein kinase n=1 Tax=Micromonospora luteifusca TaxID=709860 RepID=A0ABS2LNA3_9ACTN|nr:serine/threonine-protein kinase [Micromonospora luteifusca]MBM7489662.1 tRNA A-37 threonylcarbamoyl transferase component Bud32 [Micromonospora luteifusca]